MAKRANVATLSVSIIARTKQFRKAMRKLGQRIKRTAARIKRMAVIMSTVAAAGFALMIRNAFKTGDALAKMSQRLGFTVEELQRLQFIGKRAGVEINQLNIGMQRMIRRMAEAAKGTGEAQQAIKELGLDAKELVKLSPLQMLLRVADAFGQVTNRAEAIQLAFKLVDSEGVGLINVFDQGSEKLREQIALYDRLVGGIKAIDTFKIERANNAFLILTSRIKVLATRAAADLAPVLEQVSLRLAEWVRDGSTASMVFINGMSSVAVGATKLIDLFVHIEGSLRSLELVGQMVFLNLARQMEQWVARMEILLSNLPVIGAKSAIAKGLLGTGTGKVRDYFKNLRIGASIVFKFFQAQLTMLVKRKLPSENIKALFDQLAKDVEELFKKWNQKTKEATNDFKAMAGLATPSLATTPAGRQFRPSFTSPTALSTVRPTPVFSKQWDVANRILGRIERNTTGRTAATVAP